MMRSQEWQQDQRSAEDASGTHIPFTAPLLSGVCARRSRSAPEFLMPNPSGRRGIYVVSWKSVAEYASPTLHDHVLSGRLAELDVLDPPSVRAAATGVALEGYAGPAVAEAAERGRAREDGQQLRLWSRLMMALIEDASMGEEERIGFLQRLGRAGPRMMTTGLNTLADRLGWEPGTLFEALGRLSTGYAPLLPGGRMTVLLVLFERMRGEIAREISLLRAERGTGHALNAKLGRLLPDLEHCQHHGRALTERALRRLDQPLGLLRDWQTDPILSLRPAIAAESALDGWDHIACLWQDCATSTARVAVLPELAALLRLLSERIRAEDGIARNPVETRDETAIVPAARDHPGETTLAGSIVDLVERNERVRALELELGSLHA
ncbi:hypothetical protein NFI95_12390 [Acetobacteraceae bacterium KSS8]|uniref:Uncharacterized protein n=1 Tax=Endosaccharibacter trunci TaxID=2812733 RepID=A0ABT1WAH0_9PROT|nr:hypothetical protein [Acetobacteraceae bacterium KSS8]